MEVTSTLYMLQADMYFILLTASSQAFFHLKECRFYRGYQRLYASMHDKGIGPSKTQFRRDENYVDI
ncbi:hypothetical protein HanXRQr2_Chr04g0151411 [Helianthus annuus]|uniref:Uncharacterized protein n=2 Tax=Helianthus annuus TaxID=4232 RepID=A0A9K3NR80_HELAN|nr:hypothetical protein HanXRQr2_Chr04g0151411 [Helianthus annuus]